jgi:2-polyprenyl-3-methyl-5-hydroxy-6-metoxy-1,4-benzoquinol methylase
MPETKPTTDYAYWEYTSSKPTQNHAYLWPPVLEMLRRRVPPPTRVLDAGCGSGGFCGVMRRELGVEVCGCDLSESGIALARRNAPDCRFEQLSVYDDFVEAFDTKWDAVVSIEVIEHLYDPFAFLERIRQSLAPGGIFILTTPYHGYLKNLLIALGGRYDRHHTPLNTGGHVKFWSRNTLTAALHRAGFRIVEFRGVGRWPWLWKSMVVAAEPLPGSC